MRTFDYATAWHEAAYPAFLALPQIARDTLAIVEAQAHDLQQKPDLDMPWTPPLREAFERLDTATLACASRAIYFAGHWHPGKTESVIPRDGSTWKFSHYADQLLSERLGLPRGISKGSGTTWRILEGALRACFSTPSSWQWEEIDYASPELLAELQADPARPSISAANHTRRAWDEWADKAMAWAKSKASKEPLFDTERFMVEEVAS